MVTVYFPDGKTVHVSTAVEVKTEPFESRGTATQFLPAISLYDKDGKVVGRFILSQIAGYDLEIRSRNS